MSTPTTLVVFGTTGDLMARKIIPSLAYLEDQGRLPAEFGIIGWGRRGWDDAHLQAYVRGVLSEYTGPQPKAGALEAFIARFRSHDGTFDDDDAYERLAQRLDEADAERGVCGNKLFYLAVPPEHYTLILQNLANSGLTSACSPESGYTRVLVEKPFGHDATTAQDLDELLGSLFREEQIYRIDHYLAKEMLQGILSFRFSNMLFEPSWNARSVSRIDIRLHESIGVDGRGAFYEGVGALRDVGQNHLLQMLALVTMDQPADFAADAIRSGRLAVLRMLQPLTEHGVATHTFRAQYDGYRALDDIAPDSTTETYFRVEAALSGSRWGGVPVMMESGKCMGHSLKEISVTFKRAPQCLCLGEGSFENIVTFQLEPEETIRIRFWAKKPGFDTDLEPRELTFLLYEADERVQYVEEYAKLLLDAIAGDQTLFVSTGEVAEMWRFIDPIVRGWAEGLAPLETYPPNSAEIAERASVSIQERVEEARPQVAVAGLGKMGAGLARNLLDHGWRVGVFNRTTAVAEAMEGEGFEIARTLREIPTLLAPPRVVWLMVPAGPAVEAMIFGEGGLAEVLEPGDTIIDGGNSFWRDTRSLAPRLAEHGIRFIDVGTSGGPAGARHGACLMIGGQPEDYERLVRLWRDISVPGGFAFFRGHGAGHFVKMVHNGIEYGMMQAIAEGYTLLHAAEWGIDLQRATEIYNNGSVIESRLVGWLGDGLSLFGQDLRAVSSTVGHTGEGGWMVQTADDLGVEDRVIKAALQFRLESEDHPSYTGKLLQAMRNRFGGHAQ